MSTLLEALLDKELIFQTDPIVFIKCNSSWEKAGND